MSVKKNVPISPVDVEIFHWISDKFDMLSAGDGKSDHHHCQNDSFCQYDLRHDRLTSPSTRAAEKRVKSKKLKKYFFV